MRKKLLLIGRLSINQSRNCCLRRWPIDSNGQLLEEHRCGKNINASDKPARVQRFLPQLLDFSRVVREHARRDPQCRDKLHFCSRSLTSSRFSKGI